MPPFDNVTLMSFKVVAYFACRFRFVFLFSSSPSSALDSLGNPCARLHSLIRQIIYRRCHHRRSKHIHTISCIFVGMCGTAPTHAVEYCAIQILGMCSPTIAHGTIDAIARYVHFSCELLLVISTYRCRVQVLQTSSPPIHPATI